MIWGYLQLTGKIEEPFVVGLKRIITLAVVLAVALRLWLYNTVVVDTFFNAPAELAAVIVGAYDAVTTVDRIIFLGGDAAALLIQKGGILDGSFSYDIAGFAVYLIVGITAVYTIFLLALSRIALSLLLALGPLFIAFLLFDSTKQYFVSWLGQLANYALITLLAVLAGGAHDDTRHCSGAGRYTPGRRNPDRRCGQGLHGSRAHLSRHAPGHADRRRACARGGAAELRRGQPCGQLERATRFGLGKKRHGLRRDVAAARSTTGRGSTGSAAVANQSNETGGAMRKICLICCLGFLVACATPHAARVNCDAKLSPINSSAAPVDANAASAKVRNGAP